MTTQEPIEPIATVVAADESRDDLDSEAPPTTGQAVGYRRPPRQSQFAPGKSGNPKGRPRGSRTLGAILQEILRQKISITENGKARRVTALEAMFFRLRNDALRSDAGALKLLLSLFDRYGDSRDANKARRHVGRGSRDPNAISKGAESNRGDRLEIGDSRNQRYRICRRRL